LEKKRKQKWMHFDLKTTSGALEPFPEKFLDKFKPLVDPKALKTGTKYKGNTTCSSLISHQWRSILFGPKEVFIKSCTKLFSPKLDGIDGVSRRAPLGACTNG